MTSGNGEKLDYSGRAGPSTAAEVEERIRIVEGLIVAGRAHSIESVQLGLAENGRPDVSPSTVNRYMKAARERLAAQDDKLKAARQEILLRILINDAAQIGRLLRDGKVDPRWSDKMRCLELLGKFLGFDQPVDIGPPLPVEDELDGKSEDELDELLLELLKKGQRSVSSIQEAAKKPEHDE